MKIFYLTIAILLIAMMTLAYLYFSKLNKDTDDLEISIYAATEKAVLIFSFQNDKRVLELLKSQNLLQSILPEENLKSIQVLQEELLANPGINSQLYNANIYLSFIPGDNKDFSFMLSTQLNQKQDPAILLNSLKKVGINVEQLTNFNRITLKDSSTFYLAQKNKLLLLSKSFKAISEALKATEEKNNKKFINYINSNLTLSKNSLATVYMNLNYLKDWQKVVTPKRINQQDAFANFSYSFSKERILFNGSTTINDNNSYLNLFSAFKADKINIDAIFPENSANYSIYLINNYANWRKGLTNWFIAKKKMPAIDKLTKRINTNYNLDLEATFPKYFKNQIATFELKSKETFGVINLSNGDKLRQLLLDISIDYNDDIKGLKEPDLLYAYFGEPFEQFRKPYYTIIDNYMVFSNYPSSIQVFLNSYKNNKQLINNKDYMDTYNQLGVNSSIVYYYNHKNSENIALSDLYLPFYKLYKADQHFGQFNSLVIQMNSDQNKFQTNVLISKKAEPKTDTIPSF